MKELDSIKSFFKDMLHYTVRFSKYTVKSVIKTIRDFDYDDVFDSFRKNLKVLFHSKSIYFIALFLPIILTLVMATGMRTTNQIDYEMGFPASEEAMVAKFITSLKSNNLGLYEFPTKTSCLNSIKSGKTSFCLSFSDAFLTVDNQTDTLSVYINEDSVGSYDTQFSKINSSLVSVVKTNNLKDPISLKKISVRNYGSLILIQDIIIFFLMFLCLIFTSVTFYHRRPKLSEFYSNPNKFKHLLSDVFLSTFVFFLIASIVVYLGFAFAFGLSFGIITKALMVLILAFILFIFMGLFIGIMTTTEDINLFVTITVSSLMIFLSGLVLPSAYFGSTLSYLFNLNPYFLITKLLNVVVLFGNPASEFLFEIVILVAYLLIFVVFFYTTHYLFAAGDALLRNILKDKDEPSLEVEKTSYKYGGLNTEDISINQFQRLEEIRRKQRHHTSISKPSYKKVVKVNVEKNSRHDKHKQVEHGALIDGDFETEDNDSGVTKEQEEEPREDAFLEELYQEQLAEEAENDPKARTKKASSPAKLPKAKKTKASSSKTSSDEDDLILTIELENQILELKSDGLSDKQIIEKLKKKFKEEDIHTILTNIN